MYIAHKCDNSKCRREFILLEQDLVNIREIRNEIYIVCPYCSSRNIKVSGRYDNLKECMQNKEIFKRVHGKIKRIN